MSMVRDITDRARAAREASHRLGSRCRITRQPATETRGARLGFRPSDLVEVAGGMFDARGLGFWHVRSTGMLMIETDAEPAEVLARVIASARRGSARVFG